MVRVSPSVRPAQPRSRSGLPGTSPHGPGDPGRMTIRPHCLKRGVRERHCQRPAWHNKLVPHWHPDIPEEGTGCALTRPLEITSQRNGQKHSNGLQGSAWRLLSEDEPGHDRSAGTCL